MRQQAAQLVPCCHRFPPAIVQHSPAWNPWQRSIGDCPWLPGARPTTPAKHLHTLHSAPALLLPAPAGPKAAFPSPARSPARSPRPATAIAELYGPAVLPLIIVFCITSIETVGDVTATEEASFINTSGPNHEKRIKGALLNDGALPALKFGLGMYLQGRRRRPLLCCSSHVARAGDQQRGI